MGSRPAAGGALPLLQDTVDDAVWDADRDARAAFAERLGGTGRPVSLSGDPGPLFGATEEDPVALWCLFDPDTAAALQALDVALGAEAAATATRTPLAVLARLPEADDLFAVARAAGSVACRMACPFAVGVVDLAGSGPLDPHRLSLAVRAMATGFAESGVHGILLEGAPSAAVGCSAVRAARAAGLPVACAMDAAAVGDPALLRLSLAALAASGARAAGASGVPWARRSEEAGRVADAARAAGVGAVLVVDASGAPEEAVWDAPVGPGAALVGLTGARPALAASLATPCSDLA